MIQKNYPYLKNSNFLVMKCYKLCLSNLGNFTSL